MMVFSCHMMKLGYNQLNSTMQRNKLGKLIFNFNQPCNFNNQLLLFCQPDVSISNYKLENVTNLFDN